MDLRFEIVRDFGWFSENAAALAELESHAEFQNHYFSLPWLSAWLKRQEPLTKVVVCVVYSGESLIGMWPFVERPGLLGTKGLWPFVYDEANYFHPICRISAVPSLVGALKSLLGEFLFCWIPLMSQSFWTAFCDSRLELKKLPQIHRIPRKTSLIFPDQGISFSDYWSQKAGSKSRKSFRYDQKALSKEGKVTIDLHDTFESIRSAMPASCLVEVESWKSQEGAGLYSIRGKRGFFFELLPQLAASQKARVAILRLDQRPIAWQVELLGEDSVGIHHLSYDRKWKRFSPGKQLLNHQLSLAWEEKRKIDLLPCNLEYKEKISGVVESVHEFHAFRKSIRGFLARRLILGNMKARRKIRRRAVKTKAIENMMRALEEK